MGKPDNERDKEAKIVLIQGDKFGKGFLFTQDTLGENSGNPMDSLPKKKVDSTRILKSILILPSYPVPIGIKSYDRLALNEGYTFKDYWVKTKVLNQQDDLFYRPDLIQAYQLFIVHHPHGVISIPEHGIPRTTRPIWVFLLLLFIIVLLTIIKAQFPTDLESLNKSLFRDRFIRDDRELGFLKSPSSFLILIAFGLSSALLVYFYLRDQKIESTIIGYELFGWLSLGILAFFAFKIILLSLIGFIFQNIRLIQSYLSLNYIVIANFTLAIVPFLAIYTLYKASLLPFLLVWIPFIVVLFFLFLYIRSLIFVVSNYRFFNFYLFLYFCAIEVCPVLIVFKVIYA